MNKDPFNWSGITFCFFSMLIIVAVTLGLDAFMNGG